VELAALVCFGIPTHIIHQNDIYTVVNALRGPTASVTAAGVVAIVGSVLVLLGTAFGFLAVLTLLKSQAGPALPSLARATAEGTMVLFFGLAILGIFTGVGVLRLKNWARISVLVWSGVTAAICAFILAFLAFIPFPVPPNAGTPSNMATLVRLSTALVYGLPLAIAVWWLILFSRKTIAAQFETGIGNPLDPSGFPVEPTSASKPTLPLPITVLAVFLLFSSLSVFLIFLHLPVLFFAHALRGPVGTVAWITTCLLSTAAGIGLLRRKLWSYWLTLGLQLLWLLSGVVTLTSPKYPDLMHEAMSSMTFSTTPYPEYPIERLRTFSYAGLAFPIFILILLLWYRSRFLRACAAQVPSK
jgi:hypothetical protein